jgi:hypothetical protein
MISQEHIFGVLVRAKIFLPNWAAEAKVPPVTALSCLRLSSRKLVPDNLYRSDGCMPHPCHWCSVFGTKGEVPDLRGDREPFDVDKQNGFSDDTDALSASPSGFARFRVEASRRLLVIRFFGKSFFARSIPVLPMLLANELPPELTKKTCWNDETLLGFMATRTFALVSNQSGRGYVLI